MIPDYLDRLIVHQVDLTIDRPGGINTCIDGIAKYGDRNESLGVVGVDSGKGANQELEVGKWAILNRYGRPVHFLPVARLDPADQRRRLPHGVRLLAGMIRHRAILPSAKVLQTHRSDVGLLSPYVVRHDYHAHLIHTQSAGMTQTGTDSLWRYGSRLHARIETQVIEKADGIAVFNPVYGDSLASTNARAASFPTWFDPQDLPAAGTSKSAKSANRILWVGRFETPKNPLLALDAFEQLNQISSDGRWEMVMIGDGTMMEHCRNRINSMPKSVAQRISLTGAIPRAMVADEMSNSRVLLMTSNPGYEGYPRVMVEALAAGMSIASTLGADTGGLIENGINGQKTGADRRSLAEAIVKASSMSSQSSVDKVAGLRADVVVHDLLTHLSPSTGLRDC